MIKQLLIVILLSIVFSIEEKYTLVISFDGFRYDYLSFVDTPNFDSFIDSGVYAESLIPVFPSLTFPNHYSIATGSYADNHKILANTFYSKTLKRKYSMRDSDAVQDGKFYGAEPIWVTAEKNNVKTATYFWIGSEAEINGYRPSIYKNYDGSVSFESRVDSIVKWLEYPIERRPKISMLYFSEPDYTGHGYGVSTEHIKTSIKEMDELFGYIIEKLSKLDIYESMNILVVSDHGMADVSPERVILLDEYINLEDFNEIGGPSVTGLNLKEDLFVLNPKSFRKEMENAQIFSKNNIPKEYHYINNDTPDYIILADEGWFITTNTRLKQKRSFPLGMHGYDSKNLSMHGIFFAKGPSFKNGHKIPSFENINIYPMICSIHNLTPYNYESQKNIWDMKLINSILK